MNVLLVYLCLYLCMSGSYRKTTGILLLSTSPFIIASLSKSGTRLGASKPP